MLPMGTLLQMVEPWLGALNAMASAASAALQNYSNSETTFSQHCAQLVGDSNMSFQGLGATAFYNLSRANEGSSMMVNAKIHDFYNASHNLHTQIEDLCNQYDDINSAGYWTGLVGPNGSDIYLRDFLEEYPSSNLLLDIVQKFRDSFAAHAALDDVLSPVNMEGAIFGGTNWARGELITKINHHYQTTRQRMQADSLSAQEIPQFDQRFQDVLYLIQTLQTNVDNQLQAWAAGLYTLTMTYYQEVLDASKIDQPTVADFVYESSLPQFANSPVLIWQLPDGSLFIMIKGGDQKTDEDLIRQYFARYGIPNGTKVTIMGYKDGMGTAQAIIKQSVEPDQTSNPDDLLPFTAINAIMLGDPKNLPDWGNLPVNYIDYSTTPENGENKPGTFLGLTKEQLILMTLTGVAAVALGSPELLAGEFVAVFGDLAEEKLMDYAVTLGYNAANPEGQTPQEYLYNKLKSTQGTLIDGIPQASYFQQQISMGNTYPRDLATSHQPIRFLYTLPDEPGAKSDYTNNAYLGSQFVLDPTGMSKLNEGAVTIPTIDNPLPPSTGN